MIDHLFAAAIGWAVPLALAWLFAQIPAVRQRLNERPQLKLGLLTAVFSALVTVTAIYVYDAIYFSGSLPKNGTPAATNGGYGPVTTTCPDGYYAVGLTSWGNSAGSYCIGCLVKTQLVCKKLQSR
ncbi:hypothetical protein FJ970_30445 [Mesorhizobium sp. B2-1-8]|uniref:hypothetical protein n=1 Tax=Mesorhizobium sp. B2-1-8 TaxID=2589967 RepID=UPI0011271C31|nr:hypothetical protein [Mesorhizobium sp. B2-1-8]UCI19276.1 hypothetical protein FJ970_30445 [Mesorhizobium sp. B2-1-8]